LPNWYAEISATLNDLKTPPRKCSSANFRRGGKIASHLGPEIENAFCQRLGLTVAPVASQVIQRDRHAHYFSTLAIIAATMEKSPSKFVHLQRTEVREAERALRRRQRGSSAMPHKTHIRSPANRSAAWRGWCAPT